MIPLSFPSFLHPVHSFFISPRSPVISYCCIASSQPPLPHSVPAQNTHALFIFIHLFHSFSFSLSLCSSLAPSVLLSSFFTGRVQHLPRGMDSVNTASFPAVDRWLPPRCVLAAARAACLIPVSQEQAEEEEEEEEEKGWVGGEEGLLRGVSLQCFKSAAGSCPSLRVYLLALSTPQSATSSASTRSAVAWHHWHPCPLGTRVEFLISKKKRWRK